MDESSSLTLTSSILIALCLVIFGLLLYRYFGHRQAVWSRSYKEEKIGLSAHKLFKPNGYMIHSGSELLLSSSGSFKRFDTVDKDSLKNTQHQNSPKHATTPLWNLGQNDLEIPPQPLRPAPAPGPPNAAASPSPSSHNTNQPKIVTFSLQLTNECPAGLSNHEPVNIFRSANGHSSLKHTSPMEIPPLEAPPKPKVTTNHVNTTICGGIASHNNIPNTAIPRPVAKKSPQQNGFSLEDNPYSFKSSGMRQDRPPLQRANTNIFSNNNNNNTNPFLENTTATTKTIYNTALSINQMTNDDIPEPKTTEATTTAATIPANPFIEETKYNTISSYRKPSLASHNEVPPPSAVPFTFRSRSFSQTEVPTTKDESPMISLKNLANVFQNPTQSLPNPGNPFVHVARKIKGPHMLQKTISEDFLFRKFGYSGFGGTGTTQQQSSLNGQLNGNGSDMGNGGTPSPSSSWNFSRFLMQEDTPFGLWRRNSSQTSLNSGSMTSLVDGGKLERAISCESVDSDYESLGYTNDFDQSSYTQITGYLCVGLNYDKNSITPQGVDLQVNIIEAKGLILPFKVDSIDTFVRVYLVPDQTGSLQTKVVEDSSTPTYNEALHFWLSKHYVRHSLWFHLFHNGDAHTLIGEAEMEIGEIPKPTTTWIPLTDSRKINAQWGELMFSLSYLPTAERITIVVVKARNLQLRVPSKRNPDIMHDIQNIFVKVYLMNNDKKVLKKRTSLKRKDRCPVFNEFVIFSLPPQSLTTAQIRLTVYGTTQDDPTTVTPLGHVFAGSSCSNGKGLRHWHQMLSSLRKPVAMWHVLRRGGSTTLNNSVIDGNGEVMSSGGAEAVHNFVPHSNNIQCAKRNSVF
ncbi:synaptotagmin 12 [Musca autumnalis]|uniref:synaptotagmin 12 n=1 Tax=Musca autumnalis TaxID=221902 RepID=UPI003CEA7185